MAPCPGQAVQIHISPGENDSDPLSRDLQFPPATAAYATAPDASTVIFITSMRRRMAAAISASDTVAIMSTC